MKKTHVLLMTLILTIATLAQAQSKEPAKDTRASDKVDLKKLEDKYWSAKDDDYGVIQNRTYSKTGKLYLSLLAGTLINDPFAKGKPVGLATGYFFNEDFGVELSYLNHAAKKNENVEKLNSINTAVSPNYNLVKNAFTVAAVFTPLYAKLAFLNQSIMYFDMGLSLGLGRTQYEQVTGAIGGGDQKTSKSGTHVELGIVQQLFITKNIAFRLDFKNTFYKQTIVPYQKNFNTTTGDESKSVNDTSLTFGLTVFTN